MNPVRQKLRGKSWIFWLVLLLFLEWFSFRNMYGTGNLFGDLGDGRLTTLIAEHWYRFFRGEAAFADLGMFYPAANTLAYSDMFLGFGIVHSLLRFLGLDMYLAFKHSILAIHLFGTMTCFWLLWRVLGVRNTWAAFGAAAFSFSDSFITGLLHTQLASFSFLPLVLLLAVRFFQCFRNRKKRNLYAYLAILSMTLILYTAWYTAFFTALFLCTVLAAALCFLPLWPARLTALLKDFFRTLKWDLAGYLLFGAALIVPFVLLELPLLRTSGGYDFSEIRQNYLPGIAGLIHVSAGNWLLGGLESGFSWFTGKNHEVIRGFSIVLLLVFAYTVIALIVRMIRARRNGEMRGNVRDLLCGIAAAAILLDLLLMIRWPGNGFSLWEGIFRFFPGGKSIRAVGRFMLYLNLPLSVLTAFLAGSARREPPEAAPGLQVSRWIVSALSALLFCLLTVSNINTVSISPEGVISPWNHQDAVERISRVAPPPEDCEVFYLADPTSDQILPFLQTEACEIAAMLNLKTINGYSGQFPPGWMGIWDIRGEQYQDAVFDWIAMNNVRNVYEYNQADNAWYGLLTGTD